MAGYGRIRDEEVVEGLDLKFMKIFGAWGILNHFRDTGEKNLRLKAWMIVHWLAVLPAIMSSIAGPFAIQKTLEGMTVIMVGPMSTIQVLIKFDFYWRDLDFPTRLMELLKRDFLKSIPSSRRLHVEAILGKSVKTANFLAGIMFWVNLIIVTTYQLIPIIRSEFFRCTLGITFFGKAPPGQNKVLAYWWPVDVDASPWTEIVYMYETLLLVWSALIITLFEIMLVQFIVLLSGHLEVLQYLLSDIKDKSDENSIMKLTEYVDEHNRMTEIGNEMRLRFNIMVTLITVSGFIILISTIFIFFLRSDEGDWLMSIKSIMYLSYVLAEVFVYCYASSELEVISEKVCFGAYSSEWSEMNVKSRKALLMIMMRSRKPVVLRALWYPVNIELLNNFVNTAYSTSMLMYKVTTDE